MPYSEDRYYAPAMMAQSKQQQQQQQPQSSAYHTPSVLRPSTMRQPPLPAKLEFYDATTLLTFMSSLASPSQLLSVSTLHIQLGGGNSSTTTIARQQVGQVAMGVHLMLRYTHNLEHLYLQWADSPSSVLTGTSFRLTTFSSTLFVDGTVIQFLEAQSSIRVLELGGWGAHLPPSSSTAYNQQYPPAPPMLAPTALPALAEFTGHAEVAAQLASGGRPLQSVHLISGLPSSSSSSSSSSSRVTAEWREIMSGLAASPIGVQSLSVVGIERFGLEMLAEIGRHLHDLDYLFLRVQRPASSSSSTVRIFSLFYSRLEREYLFYFGIIIGRLPMGALEELSLATSKPRTNRRGTLRPHSIILFFIFFLVLILARNTPERSAHPTMAQHMPTTELGGRING